MKQKQQIKNKKKFETRKILDEPNYTIPISFAKP